ncbi:MAG: cytochrome d ubiquinol oxidase subunit II, partial [Pseudomonadota bacterium]
AAAQILQNEEVPRVAFHLAWIDVRAHRRQTTLFGLISGLCVMAAYALIGAGWLIIKTDNQLQQKSIRWARLALPTMCIGLLAVSLVNPLVSDRIFHKWFTWPQVLWLIPLPLLTGLLLWQIHRSLAALTINPHKRIYLPFLFTTGVYVLAFIGLAYSFYPYVVPDELTVWQAASHTSSLWIIFIGTVVVLPMILGYTVLSYYIFRGKARDLAY